MKRCIALFVISCFFLLLFCGCIPEQPEHLPGSKEEDVNFVWVCEAPFSYFVVDRVELYNGYPCLKGYMTKGNEPLCFYLHEENNAVTTFVEQTVWESKYGYDAFWGDTVYYENYFECEVEHDRINFFDGELPKLRFDKMTKEDFLEKYGDIDGVSENLLKLETYDLSTSRVDKYKM